MPIDLGKALERIDFRRPSTWLSKSPTAQHLEATNHASALEQMRSNIDVLYARDATRRTNSSRLIKSGLVLLGAVIAGVAQAVSGGESTNESMLTSSEFWQAVGVFMVFIGGVWTLFAEPTAPEALQEARRALDVARESQIRAAHAEQRVQMEIEEWKEACLARDEHIEWLSSFSSVTLALREMLENYFATKDQITDEDLQCVLSRMCNKLNGLIGYDGGEYWTLAIFRPKQDDTGCLECVAKERADRLDNQNTTRTWRVGEGLVGHVFMTGREAIIEDVTDDDRVGWLNLPNKRADDEIKYRSLIGVPVLVGGAPQPWGVVVATSDTEGRFEPGDEFVNKSAETIRLLAGFMALAATRYAAGKIAQQGVDRPNGAAQNTHIEGGATNDDKEQTGSG